MLSSALAVVLPPIQPPVVFADSFISRVENWRKWLLTGSKRGRCGSAEGNYRPPPCWHPPEPTVFVDHFDALKVNLAWQSLPTEQKSMVKYAMVYREHWRTTCRKLHIGTDRYDDFLMESLIELRNNLQSS